MSKLVILVLLPLLAVGALLLAVLSLWSVEHAHEPVQAPRRQRADRAPMRGRKASVHPAPAFV